MKTLNNIQRATYRDKGFLVVPGLFSRHDIRELVEECKRVWSAIDISETNQRIQWRKRIDGSRVCDRIDPVLDLSPLLESTAKDSRITHIAAALLNCDKPEIFKGKLISKWPQTTGYALHQDYTYWPGVEQVPQSDFVTALMALDPFEALSGALELFPGEHHHPLKPARDNPRDLDESAIDLSTGITPELAPGDVVFFHSMTPHRSGPNLSQSNRQSLFFTYVASGHDSPGQRYYKERQDDFMDPN